MTLTDDPRRIESRPAGPKMEIVNPLLAPLTLLHAYSQGIFPMDVEGELQWFSPPRRAILPLDGLHVPRTLRQLINQGRYEIRIDTAFGGVMEACGDRPVGTWISREIVQAYLHLHELGFAHSVEAWRDGQLAGGLYGVALGAAFFGESMFYRQRDASKVALVALVEHMCRCDYRLLDVQYSTPHLQRFGIVSVPRAEYLKRLTQAIRLERSFAPNSGGDAQLAASSKDVSGP